MESLEGLWEKFSLSEHESQKVDLVSTTTPPKSFLAAKFLTRRALNVEAVARTFKPLWRTDHGFSIRDMNENKLVFVFDDEADRERVMLGEPWAYDKYLVILQRIEEDEAIEEVTFTDTSFWVQLHGIPVRRMNHEVAAILGSSLGKIARVTGGETSVDDGQAMRIRVSIDITKPLCRGRKAKLERGRETWISFKYERLPNFCYWCGLVTHSDKDCPHWLRNQETLCLEDQQFGSWLRASNERPWRKMEIKIDGIIRPPHPKQPTKPPPSHVSPIPTHTQSYTEPPPTNTIIPPSTSHQTPLHHHFTNPPPLNNTTTPTPPTVAPVAFSSPTHDDYPTHMELEENPETWQDEGPLEKLRCQLQFDSKFIVNRRNKGGGLCLFWKKDVKLSVQSFSHSHIDALVNDNQPDTWRFTGFYGAPETHKREESWDLLRRLNAQLKLPWCCMGDFNELVRIEEKQGRHTRSESQMQLFRDVLDECGFVDLGFTGPKFTWTNNRPGDMTWERLDRVVATPDWLLRFPSARVSHLEGRWSDHKPIWVSTETAVIPKRKPFRFEEVWTSDQGCEAVIEDSWKQDLTGVPMYTVWQKIHACRRGLRLWSRTTFGNITSRIKEVERLLKIAEENSMQGRDHHRVNQLKRELHSLLAKEERLWRQRSRAEWLHAGDRNTRYFHCRATQRKRKNHVTRLRTQDGQWTATQAQVPPLFVEYYKSLFQTANPDQVEQVVEDIQCVVTAEMNSQLISEFTAVEVEIALKQMAPLKAPGPDSLPPIFYQKYWHLIGRDVTAAVLTCLNSGQILKAINHTHITLIPKVQNPEEVVEFRPISLCNVIYKLISKVLANRLKILLPSIVFESQSAFIPGRLITDNILVAFETLHHMQHQKTGKTGSMALKLDMSKAYDRVEWQYLKGVMEKMGFHNKWVTLMMECISTVSYSILVNGEPHGYIKPSRGLRQGDPLSPYLFLLCAEGLHSLIQKEKISGALKGVSISRSGPKITHLFFADDSLLFCKATTDDVIRIQGILSQYEQASGQQVNRQKTTLFFSKSTPLAAQLDIQNMLGVPAIKQYERYLGLPSFVGRAKYSSFAQIKERVWSKLKGWKEKLISQAGREILIKSVAQAIPAYAMSCFRLPTRLIKEIEVLIRRFWWGQGGDKGKMHWLPWRTLCKSKRNGGMGLRDLGFFNEALLAKQVWRLLHNPSSLFSKVFKAKYFPHCSILEAQQRSQGSYAWKSIMSARDLIVKGSVWRVGTGSHIRIWRDKWLPDTHSHCIVSPPPPSISISHVQHLIDSELRSWKAELVKRIFLPHEASVILGIPLSIRDPIDSLVWKATKNGAYTVRSGYHLLLNECHQDEPSSSDTTKMTQLWDAIWSLHVPPKIRHFLWRACHNSLPTRSNLHHRHILADPSCSSCTNQIESTIHALWQCKEIKPVWQSIPWGRKLREISYAGFIDLILQQPVDNLSQLIPRALDTLLEFQTAQNSDPQPSPKPNHTKSTTWKPPEEGRYKVNYDGAVFSERNEAGVGVIIRNYRGEVMGSLSHRIPYPHSVEAVEASAASCAIQFAKDLGFMLVDLEGDSKIIVEALLLKAPCTTIYGNVIEDIKQSAQNLQSVHFLHINREGNAMAHLLAKRARLNKPFEVWMESVPPELISNLCTDFHFQ
uniref:Reverse transcriptase domain-containing protein n=1 Tax=Fagus sylvatica TaxID=28930 RepID=A0A2N9FFZ2_FAGSY